MAVKARLRSYAEPAFLIVFALFYLFKTAITNLRTLLSSPSAFRQLWFSEFWKFLGPRMAATPYQLPYISELLGRAHGTCLEFGPGIGSQSRHFRPDRIEHLYGAEPNNYLHQELLQNSHAAGLENYTVLSCGAQPSTLLPALREQNLLPSGKIPDGGIFDSIITVKSLCSAPQRDLEETVDIVRRLLKPGGEFIFFEHVHSTDDPLTRTLVYITNIFWPGLMGGCRLDGKLDAILRKSPGWRTKDIRNIDEYSGFEPIRYVRGVCVTDS